MAKQNGIELHFTPRDIGRGEWGKKFYISTFRFPLEEAQKFERRAKVLNLTMASLMSQLMMTFNKAVGEPKNVKTDRTTHPTIWGTKEKVKFFKKKGLAVPVKRSDAKLASKKKVVVSLKNPKKVAAKVKKPEGKSSAAALLARLKALRKSEAA